MAIRALMALMPLRQPFNGLEAFFSKSWLQFGKLIVILHSFKN